MEDRAMKAIKVWDPAVRLFHWLLVTGIALNALLLDAESGPHRWIGYGVAALVALRIIWGVAGSRYARFASFPPSVSGAAGQISDIATGRKTAHLGHTPLGALMIYNLIVTIIVISASGYLMTTDRFWGVAWPEDVHKAAVTWLEFSIVMHIAAVVYESLRTRINLPLAMITGKKAVPDGIKLME
jgi:cytochrome b